jgi:hypothetical protein
MFVLLTLLRFWLAYDKKLGWQLSFRGHHCNPKVCTPNSLIPATALQASSNEFSLLRACCDRKIPAQKLKPSPSRQYHNHKMSSSLPVQQALNTIIPRRSGALPPELVDLANSLLAQSRNKCSSLKPEEEVARTYVCANIACERYIYAYLHLHTALMTVSNAISQT